MNEKKWYFSLKCKGENAFHRNGELLNFTERTVNIGDSVDCDVRYESGDLQPDYYASIIRNDDGQSWRIVKRSSQVDVCILGKGSIGYASQLTDGDMIQIEGQPLSLAFHTHHDANYEGNTGNRRRMVGVTLGIACIVAAAVWMLASSHNQDIISEKDVESYEESVYMVKVDSVQHLLLAPDGETKQHNTKILSDEASTGTAFLTTDGRMVTARHCVEYWIGTHVKLTQKRNQLAEDDIIRWAIETETFNQSHTADSVMQLRVFFSFYNFMGEKMESFSSADPRVHINTKHDAVFLMADFNEDNYWRTIRPYFNNHEMELGDILWIDGFKQTGAVALASSDDLAELRNGSRLMVCGYPMTGAGNNRMAITDGVIRQLSDQRETSEERPASAREMKENLLFESNINHGFSGGPVFMKTSNGIVAVGVVSRVDSISGGVYKSAVPVTEIDKKEGGFKDE